MPDAQFPTDGDDGNGNQPRRAGLRLRDAEAVATTRRDMFGDGSLLETLAGAPPAPADAEVEEPQSAPAEPPQPNLSEPEKDLPPAGAEATVQHVQADEPDKTVQAAHAMKPAEAAEPGTPGEPAEPTEPVEQVEAGANPSAPQAEAAEPATPVERAEAAEPVEQIEAGADLGAPQSEPVEPPAPVERAEGVEPVEQVEGGASLSAPQPGAEGSAQAQKSAQESAQAEEPAERAEAGVDGSEPEPRVPHFPNPASSPFSQIPQSLDSIIDSFAAEPVAEAVTQPAVAPDRDRDSPMPQLDPVGLGSQPDGRAIVTPLRPMAVSSIFDSLGPPAGTASEPARPVDEDLPPEVAGLDMSMLGGPLPHGAPRKEPDPNVESPAPPKEDVEAATDAAAVTDAPPQDSGAVASDPSPPPATAPAEGPERPPFPEVPAESPDHADPAGLAGERSPPLPPLFPEAPAQASPDRFEPVPASPFPDAPVPPPYPGPMESAAATAGAPESGRYGAYEPHERSPFGEPAAQPRFDAAAKIAAEASATADALHNLNHLLGQSEPRGGEQARHRPATGSPPPNLMGDPAHFTLGQRVPLMPLPVPPQADQGKGIYLLGFLTGLGLSLMAGVALYFLIATG